MTTFKIGQRVRLKGSDRTGKVQGFGHQVADASWVTVRPGDVLPVLLVKLDDGAYLRDREYHDDAPHNTYVSLLAVAPKNVEALPDVVDPTRVCPRCGTVDAVDA